MVLRSYWDYVWHKLNPITRRAPLKQSSTLVAASWCGDVFHWQGLENWSQLRKRWMVLNIEKFLKKTCFSLPDICNWDRGSGQWPSAYCQSNSLRRNVSVCWNGLCNPQIPNLIKNLWHDLKIPAEKQNTSNLKELEHEGQAKVPVARCSKRLAAVVIAKFMHTQAFFFVCFISCLFYISK